MFLLDYINHIVVHSMFVQHGLLILLTIIVCVLHEIYVYEVFLSCLIPLTVGCYDHDC